MYNSRTTLSIFLCLLIFHACQKDVEKQGVPKVETASVDEVFNTSARAGGRVVDDGGAPVTERGFFWGRDSMPETTGTKRSLGEGTGAFYDTLNSLTPGTKYYVKAYAINSLGTGYGAETFFSTQIHLPTVSTSPITAFTATTATVGGNVSDNGGFKITQRGIYWGSDPNPRLTGMKIPLDTGMGTFTTSLTELERAKTYYVIAYATNIKGTSYGNEISFNTVPELPVVSTLPLKQIGAHEATFGGNISSDGGNSVTERGVYYGTSPDVQTSGTPLVMGNGSGSFSQKVETLAAGTAYYVIAYATNSQGTAWGEVRHDTTLGKPPVIKALNYTDLGTYEVTLRTAVNPHYLSTGVVFEYGTTTAYGGTKNFTVAADSNLNDTLEVLVDALLPNTIYHYRITATNELGSTQTADSIFHTYLTGVTGSMTADGVSYATIGIGYQEWMAENLAAEKFNDGSSIPNIAADSLWQDLDSASLPGYCWYNNNTANKDIYGALYNWHVVSSGRLCPAGWRVPNAADFSELENYLGGTGKAGGALKALTLWLAPNTGATNSSKFTALPGGKRLPDGTFDFLGVESNLWTQDFYSTLNASYFYLQRNYGYSFQGYAEKNAGMGVRCLRE
jgi:uncharacterized protein (TIGR02145 family)